MRKLVDERGICYSVTENGSVPMVSISNIPAGAKFYAKPNSTISSSPIVENNDGGKLSRRIATLSELQGEGQGLPKRVTFFGQMHAKIVAGTKQSIERTTMGQRYSVLYEALADDQTITMGGSFPGTIMCWNAKPLGDNESFVDSKDTFQKSIFESENSKRPQGPFCAVTGPFLAASLDVKANVYHQTVNSRTDILVKQFSETNNTFQHFSGNGYVMLEVYGGLSEFPLCPGEQINVFPGYLLGFTEGITLEIKPAGDKFLRHAEHRDYVIRLTAPQKGGYVYTHSVIPAEFFKMQDKQ